MDSQTGSTDFDLDWVAELARAAGQIALQHFRHTFSERKADATIVTEADRAVERFLTANLRRQYPEDGILGEEGAAWQATAAPAGRGRRWVLDPIDGTTVFAAGLPIWCVSIGLMLGFTPVAGVVYLPVTGDCFAVGPEGPATLNGEPIQVAVHEPYHDESILFGVADAHRAWHIDFPGKVRAYGACAAHFCYVARGSGVGAINTHTAIWDLAAALPILERAGGRCVLLDGSPLPLEQAQHGDKFPQPLIAAPLAYLQDVRSRVQYLERSSTPSLRSRTSSRRS